MGLEITESGDISAPVGSKSWVLAVRLKLQGMLHRVAVEEDHMKPFLERLEETQGWKLLSKRNGEPFKDALDFYTTPEPWGLGNHIKIESRISKLRSQGGDRKSEAFRENQPSDQKVDSYGETKFYILARLERDHPDILAAYERGEYRSARQAGIAAGFIKDIKRIQCQPTPESVAKAVKGLFTPEQIGELVKLLCTD